MQIGSLGELVFEVSSSSVVTIQKFDLSGSAKINSHDRVLKKSLPEFGGADLETISFSTRVSKFLGVNPETYANKIKSYCESGTALVFYLGKKKVGSYKWLISKFKITHENYDKYGNMIDADITLNLIEYPKG